jgi:hypothetical protein
MLEHAAHNQAQAARLTQWSREKLAQPHGRFSQPALLNLVGQLLMRFPALRSAAEQPRIYRSVA